MTRFALLTSAAIVLAPTLAHAEMPPGLYSDFEIRVAAVDGDNFADLQTTFTVDGTVRYTFSGTNFGVGLDTLLVSEFDDFDNRLDYYNLYAFYEFGGGVLSFGETASAIDLIDMDRRISLPETFDVQLGTNFLGPFINGFYLQDDAQAYGLTYEGSFDALQVAASVHYLDDFEEWVYAAAVDYAVSQQVNLLAGFEAISVDGVDPRLWLGLAATFGDFDAEVMVRTGDTPFVGDATVYTADLYYNVPTIDDLRIGATVLHLDGPGSDDTLYGVGFEYNAFRNFGIEGNFSTTDGDNTFGLEAFVRF